MPGWLTSLLAIGASILGILKRKGDTNNTPEMKKRAEAQQEQKVKDASAATTAQAMHGQTQAERDAALQKAREEDAE